MGAGRMSTHERVRNLCKLDDNWQQVTDTFLNVVKEMGLGEEGHCYHSARLAVLRKTAQLHAEQQLELYNRRELAREERRQRLCACMERRLQRRNRRAMTAEDRLCHR